MEFGIHGYYHNLNDNEETVNKTKLFKNIGIKIINIIHIQME